MEGFANILQRDYGLKPMAGGGHSGAGWSGGAEGAAGTGRSGSAPRMAGNAVFGASVFKIRHPAISRTGAGCRTQSRAFSSSSMLQGSVVVSGAGQKGFVALGHAWQKRAPTGGSRCEAAAASSAEGPAFESAPSAPGRPVTVWAYFSSALLYKTEIQGWENLPAADEGAVYVANHQSFLDIYALFQVGRPFKFISKTSIFLIPIVGWGMYLTGHIPLKREDRRSQLECLKTCIGLVKEGVSVVFFPEGTRTTDGALAAFKKGAFSVAAKGGVPVVPITLIGSRKLMPSGLEYTLGSGVIKVVIHPAIRSTNADELCIESRRVIAETLSKHGLPVH